MTRKHDKPAMCTCHRERHLLEITVLRAEIELWATTVIKFKRTISNCIVRHTRSIANTNGINPKSKTGFLVRYGNTYRESSELCLPLHFLRLCMTLASMASNKATYISSACSCDLFTIHPHFQSTLRAFDYNFWPRIHNSLGTIQMQIFPFFVNLQPSTSLFSWSIS